MPTDTPPPPPPPPPPDPPKPPGSGSTTDTSAKQDRNSLEPTKPEFTKPELTKPEPNGLRPTDQVQSALDQSHKRWDQNLSSPDHQPDVRRPNQTEAGGLRPTNDAQSVINESHSRWSGNLARPELTKPKPDPPEESRPEVQVEERPTEETSTEETPPEVEPVETRPEVQLEECQTQETPPEVKPNDTPPVVQTEERPTEETPTEETPTEETPPEVEPVETRPEVQLAERQTEETPPEVKPNDTAPDAQTEERPTEETPPEVQPEEPQAEATNSDEKNPGMTEPEVKGSSTSLNEIPQEGNHQDDIKLGDQAVDASESGDDGMYALNEAQLRDETQEADGREQTTAGKLNTGAKTGLDATPETIREGSVRMEDHPQFQASLDALERKGFRVVETSSDPHVVVRRVVDANGVTTRIDKEVHLPSGIRYLDMEHELGHVEQLTDPERFPSGPPPTDIVSERPDGTFKDARNQSGILTEWQNPIVEYHVRLKEVIALHERGVSPEILKEHTSGLEYWHERYFDRGLKGGRSPSRAAWAEEHFPDIGELEATVSRIRGSAS